MGWKTSAFVALTWEPAVWTSFFRIQIWAPPLESLSRACLAKTSDPPTSWLIPSFVISSCKKVYRLDSPTQIQLLHLIEEVSPSYMTIRGKFWVRNPSTNIVAGLFIPCHEPQQLDLLATWREGIEGDRRWETWWVPNALLGVAKWPARCGMPMRSWKQIMTFSWHQKLGSKGCLNHLDAVQAKLDPTNSINYCIYMYNYVYILHITYF